MANPSQLLLLADHIKLSLLERQRATTLNLNDDTQDGHILRSLEQFRTGLDCLRKDKGRYELQGEEQLAVNSAETLAVLERQFNDLTAEFHGFSSAATENTLTEPNSNDLAEDFSRASSRPPKTVRFSGSPPLASRELFGLYRDDPTTDTAGYRDQTIDLTNQQLHQYHNQILEDQDQQLDRLGESIGRQREISMQIGDELDNHVAMLDEMDAVVDRHQSRLERAKNVLGKVAKGAGENKQMTAIVMLIIILVLLIAILK